MQLQGKGLLKEIVEDTGYTPKNTVDPVYFPCSANLYICNMSPVSDGCMCAE